MIEPRFLGRTGVRVSPLAFGTMSFGGDADEATSAKMFHRCREEGVNTFDCADVYAKGRSEEILGELIAPCRDEVIVASKFYFPTGSGPNARGALACTVPGLIPGSFRLRSRSPSSSSRPIGPFNTRR